MLLAVRGKDLTTKTEMYQQLNEGQKGIYLFYSFHNHAKTIEEFYWFSSYYILEFRSWNGIKSGVQFFKDAEMFELLEEIEVLIVKRNKDIKKGQQVSPTDLEIDNTLLNEVKKYFDRYNEISEKTINHMNQWIINNKNDFFEMN